MKRFLLAFIISLIGIAIVSYADARNNKKHKGRNPKAVQVCHDGVAFGNKTISAMISFDPQKLEKYDHDNPTPDNSSSVDGKYLTLLGQAFCIASADVQAALKNLNYVFVTKGAKWQSYGPVGVWSSNNQEKFIVIPASSLDNILITLTSLAKEENALYTNLFNLDSDSPFSSFSDSGATSPESAVLAVLGHELGHVLLASTNADGKYYKDHPDPNRNPPDRPGPYPDKCYDDTAFLANVWDPIKAHSQGQRRWVKFGDRIRKDVYHDHSIDFDSLSGSTNMMTYLYHQGGLASMFAAVAPEEDFVETFKYYALASAKPSLDMTILGTQNVVSRVVNQPSAELAAKVGCVKTALSNMPPPQVNP
jgi:hypothetical protein